MQTAVTSLLNTLCGNCISVDNLEETHFTYGRSGKSIYITTDLIYSNSEGTVTSSTLISMLWSWLLAEDSPNITLAGYPVALSKECPIPANSLTKDVCKDLLLSSDETTIAHNTSSISNLHLISAASSLIIGFLMGAIGATVLLLLLSWYVI